MCRWGVVGMYRGGGKGCMCLQLPYKRVDMHGLHHSGMHSIHLHGKRLREQLGACMLLGELLAPCRMVDCVALPKHPQPPPAAAVPPA